MRIDPNRLSKRPNLPGRKDGKSALTFFGYLQIGPYAFCGSNRDLTSIVLYYSSMLLQKSSIKTVAKALCVLMHVYGTSQPQFHEREWVVITILT